MATPRTLKNMMLFNEGLAYIGEVQKVTLPTLTRKMEERRLGGMAGPVKFDMGMEALTLSFTCGGPMRDVLRQFGVARTDGVYLRFAGAFQRDDTGTVDNIEIIARGRYGELEMGDQEVGEPGEFTATCELAYYKLVWNGRTEIEIDMLNMVEIVGGVDRQAELRAALGIF